MGADTPSQDQQSQLDQEITGAEQAVASVKDRVAADLATLRDELEQQHAQAQQGQAVDLGTAIGRIAAITQAIEEIDLPGTPAVAAPGEPASESAPASPSSDQAAQPSAPADLSEAAPVEEPAPVYTFDGDPSTIDAAVWTPAGVQADDGRTLYHYAQDTPGQPPAGDGQGDGQWHVYTGPQSAPPQPGQPGNPPPAPPAL